VLRRTIYNNRSAEHTPYPRSTPLMKMKILLENFKKYVNEEQQELTEFFTPPWCEGGGLTTDTAETVCDWIAHLKDQMGSEWTEQDQQVVMGSEDPSDESGHPPFHPNAIMDAEGNPLNLLKHPYYIERGFDKILAPLINKWAEGEGIKRSVGRSGDMFGDPIEGAEYSDEDLKKVVGAFLRKQKRSPQDIEQILNNADTEQLQNMLLKFKDIQGG